MKLAKVKNKVLPLAIGGVLLASATTAGALMVVKNSSQPQKSSIEGTQTEETIAPQVSAQPEPTETPVPTESTTPSPSESASPTPSESSQPKNPYSINTMMGYVYDKRVGVGKVVGAWGNPDTWPYFARQAGLSVDRTPQKYDIMAGGGSVWFVDSVNSDGSITVSSYNTGAYGTGYTSRTIPSKQFSALQFIH